MATYTLGVGAILGPIPSAPRSKKFFSNTMPAKIVQIGSEILRKKSNEVPLEKIKSKEIQDLIKEMAEVLKAEEIGVGLAAPQIGKDKKIFILKDTKQEKYLVFINPQILKLSKKIRLLDEGCLSVTSFWGKVKRAESILVSAFDENGKKFEKNYKGLPAQIVQHEIDHLNGILFVDKAKELQKQL